MGRRRGSLAAASVLTALLCGAALAAGGVTIAPVLIELTPSHKVGQVTLANDGAGEITIQASAALWTQTGGEDQYVETDQIQISPVIATIPAHGSQVFRVRARIPAAAGAGEGPTGSISKTSPPRPTAAG
jgi:P pilus assembly chaperone PapD